MDITDAALVAEARAGNGDAFRVLVARHGRKLFRLAYRIVGNEEDAEDVVQETFLRAYRSLERFNEEAQFSSWIFRIASNQALDVLRARKNSGQSLAAAADGEAAPVCERLASPRPGPERLAAGSQLQVRIQIALEELSEQERVAFALRHFEGQSVEEIGMALHISAGATRNTVFRAVQKVRRALQSGEGEPIWRT